MNSIDSPVLLQRARQHRAAGRNVNAETAYRKILVAEPDHPAANFELATLLCGLGRVPEAVMPLQAAVGACPDNLDVRLQLAQVLRSLQRNEEAIAHYEHATVLNPELPTTWCNLGNIYRELGNPDEAQRCLNKAIELQPDLPEALNNLGSLFAELGRADEAVIYFRKAIQSRPDYFKAYRNLSTVRKFTELDEEVRAMQLLYKQNSDNDFVLMQLGFALGKVFEDLGNSAQAFEYWLAGNRAQRKLSPYLLSRDIAEMRKLRGIFDTGRLITGNGASRPGLVPIFVVGMPRSGTSLTEQILASHSAVFGAGELETVRRLAWYAVGGRFPEDLARLDPGAWRVLGEKYLDSVASEAGGAQFVVDKMPRNFMHIGIISMMFRNARIIHCRREPMDIGLSCFKKHFIAPDLGYSCDLDDLGTFYRHYETLMDYWQCAMPDKIYELRYEDLVADAERQILSLLAWCNIPFEESCLNFHQTRRMVSTASALQVREPIHQGAVQRWKLYEQELEPLNRALERSDED